jgi:hypothetical protein
MQIFEKFRCANTLIDPQDEYSKRTWRERGMNVATDGGFVFPAIEVWVAVPPSSAFLIAGQSIGQQVDTDDQG